MITRQEGIKNICLQEILKRLRHRDIRPDLIELKALKEELCKKRIEVVQNIKSEPWTLDDLDKIHKSLQSKKCRDPQGLANDLFKCASAGSDLKLSILHMLNKTKDTLDIPEVMTNVNIAIIPKAGTPSLHDIEKQRGIFLLSVFRTIIMKLLLQDEYEKVDTFMSDANAGGRKGRRAQDSVKTHAGTSQRKEVNNVICQGDPLGPIECSLQVDEIGKESLEDNLEPYKYKDIVKIPALGWIDDIITVSESGYKTARMNSFINTQLAV